MSTSPRKILSYYKAGRVSIENIKAVLLGTNDVFFQNIEHIVISNTTHLDLCSPARSGVSVTPATPNPSRVLVTPNCVLSKTAMQLCGPHCHVVLPTR